MVEGAAPLLVCCRSPVQILALRSHKLSKTLFALQTLQVKYLDSSKHTPGYASSDLGNNFKILKIFNDNIFKRGQ
jgi:hypothetical protein